MQIYKIAGYNTKDIPELILKNNLYGLDIDDRAGQLSILSVLLKAREYDSNIFNKEIIRNLNVLSLQESKGIDTSYFTGQRWNKGLKFFEKTALIPLEDILQKYLLYFYILY